SMLPPWVLIKEVTQSLDKRSLEMVFDKPSRNLGHLNVKRPPLQKKASQCEAFGFSIYQKRLVAKCCAKFL
ncbi:hypothetical protein, partial [Vibrio sp. F13]|uniref:hypothetical protein n=1 Tax=Vibrio sp. F13 TaxID=2070777 RepID=UPI0019D30381